jgi:hypothetical protein
MNFKIFITLIIFSLYVMYMQNKEENIRSELQKSLPINCQIIKFFDNYLLFKCSDDNIVRVIQYE